MPVYFGQHRHPSAGISVCTGDAPRCTFCGITVPDQRKKARSRAFLLRYPARCAVRKHFILTIFTPVCEEGNQPLHQHIVSRIRAGSRFSRFVNQRNLRNIACQAVLLLYIVSLQRRVRSVPGCIGRRIQQEADNGQHAERQRKNRVSQPFVLCCQRPEPECCRGYCRQQDQGDFQRCAFKDQHPRRKQRDQNDPCRNQHPVCQFEFLFPDMDILRNISSPVQRDIRVIIVFGCRLLLRSPAHLSVGIVARHIWGWGLRRLIFCLRRISPLRWISVHLCLGSARLRITALRGIALSRRLVSRTGIAGAVWGLRYITAAVSQRLRNAAGSTGLPRRHTVVRDIVPLSGWLAVSLLFII